MKKVFVGISFLFFASFSAFAQKSDGKEVVSYITNSWSDNWSIGFSGGLQSILSSASDDKRGYDASTMVWNPTYELYSTKWLTPIVGMRFGFAYGNLSENRESSWMGGHYPVPENGWKDTYLYGSLMANVVNAAVGYSDKRRFGISPYIHAGYMRILDPEANIITGKKNKELYRDREVVLGPGVFSNISLTKRLDIVIDARASLVSGRFHSSKGSWVTMPSVTVGLQYAVRQGFWRTASNIESERDEALANALAARQEAEFMMDALAKAETRIASLEADLASATITSEVVTYKDLVAKTEAAALVVKYYINSDELNFSEEHHIGELVEKNGKDKVYTLTATFDSQSKDTQADTKLSYTRAYTIKNVLIKKYGVSEANIIVNPSICAERHVDGALDRCVIIEVK